MKRKILIENNQALGDIAMLTTAVRDLMQAHGDKFEVNVRTGAMALWENNPHITNFDPNGPDVERIYADYPLIHKSNQAPVHFIHGFREDLEQKLKVEIPCGDWAGSIYISDLEKSWFSAPREILGKDVPYWVMNAGHKNDFTAKKWGAHNYQAVIDGCPDVTFVQVGHNDGGVHHKHPRLTGKNLINLVGQTDERQLIRLIYNAFGVITPVSAHMVLSYLIPANHRFKSRGGGQRMSRACVVIAGGREPNHWQQGANQQYLHTCGMLDCCDNGGCWKGRVEALHDGDEKDTETCFFPVTTPDGRIAKCMSMITPDMVIRCVRNYMDNLKEQDDDKSDLHSDGRRIPEVHERPAEQPGCLREQGPGLFDDL